MWTPVKNELPSIDGRYLCAPDSGAIVIVCGFSNDLYELDNWDFIEFKDKHKQGFYYLDNELGYIYCDDVIAWQPLPQPYTED